MILAKPPDRAISNIKSAWKILRKHGFDPLPPKSKSMQRFLQLPPFPRDPYVINEWPLIMYAETNPKGILYSNNYLHMK